nr:Ig-like domain-containing protein [Deltaproteobacteria bacterium]
AGVRARSRIIYLNRTGVTVSPGANDARINRSSVTKQQATVAPWTVDEPTWTATVACLQRIFARYDFTFTQTDPGNLPHIEAVFGGAPAQLGLPRGVAGVSPFSTTCAIVEHSMVFAFTDIIPKDAQRICEIQAQEIAHSYGLDHELLAADPMTYLSYSGQRAFQDQLAPCGETSARSCGVGGSVCRDKQNSHALLLERVGRAGTGDIEPPVVAIISPQDGATVAAGFVVEISAIDDIAVTGATLSIDGASIAAIDDGPWRFTTPATLAPGRHVIRVEATDGTNAQTTELTVTIAGPATDDGEAPAAEDPETVGCAVGGTPGSLLLGLAALALVAGRRRQR